MTDIRPRPAWWIAWLVTLGAGGVGAHLTASDAGTDPADPEPVAPPQASVSERRRAESVATGDADLLAHSAHCTDLDGAPRVSWPTLESAVRDRISDATSRARRALRRPGVSRGLRVGLDVALHLEVGDRTLQLLDAAPDRNAGDFDLLADAASLGSRRALSAGRLARARDLAFIAQRYAPRDPLPVLLEVLVAREEHDAAAARSALARAFRLAPREPAVSLAYLSVIHDGTSLEESLAAADAYLRSAPWDLFVARERELLWVRQAWIGPSVERRHRGVRLLAPGEAPERVLERALRTTSRALDDASELLALPRLAELSVFVYPTRRALLHANCEPEWVGALYDGALHVDAEHLTANPDDAEVTLRHEALHATMTHPLRTTHTASRPPTWFSEGVAQYFAPESPSDAPARHAFMLRHHTFVPMASMNGPFGVIEDDVDASLAYAQALAMVHYLVDRRGESGIADGVRYLLAGGDPDQLLAGVGAPLDGETLLEFLRTHPTRPR